MSEGIDLSSNVKFSILKQSINSIEQLSNEIFYEIFDRLLFEDISKAFSNLNNRFENLLYKSSYLLKIRFCSESESIVEDRTKHIIDSNKYQIISFHSDNQSLINKLNILYTIDSSFNHLQSIILHQINTFSLMKLLFRLKSLTHLFYLAIYLDYCDDDLGQIYQIVFHLFSLKYFKLNILNYQQLNIHIPIVMDEQLSSIEYLVIYHHLTLNQLTNLLFQTPHLTHLSCFNVTQSENDIKSETLIKLNNLEHLILSINDIKFDQFEKFILKFSSHLSILNVTINDSDKNYLDGNQWKYLISQHIPYLSKFIFYYSNIIDKNFQIELYYPLINHFISPFYLKKQWIFKIFIKNDKIIYLIHPSRNVSDDFQQISNRNNHSIYSNLGVHISIMSNFRTKENEPFSNKILPLFRMFTVNHLTIDCKQTNSNMFFKILSVLPTLDSIKIISFPTFISIAMSKRNADNYGFVIRNNKITKLSLRDISHIKQILFLIDIFRHIKFIELEQIENYGVEVLIRATLWKIEINNHHHLKTLCLIVNEKPHDNLEKLKKIINTENLLNDYTLYRRYDKYYLQWK